jgi:peptidoglycan/LPS O-acetylase OafA/YrhL
MPEGVAASEDQTVLPRLKRAFSVRRNVRLLFVPTSDRLRPLDGLRALSVLWVVVFHAGWYIGLFLPIPEYLSLVFSPRMLPVWRGDFGVDMFFVLSGFLIAGMLIDERERTGHLNLGLFYARRLARLWPALVVGVLVDVLVLGDPADKVWANLLYVSNFVPVLQGVMGWTWSLAMEEQFYLVCPWLVRAVAKLRAGQRVAVILGIAGVLCGVAAWIVVTGAFGARDSEIVLDRDFLRWTYGYDHLYVKPWMRAGGLLMGVASAFVYRSTKAMHALETKRGASIGLLVLALAVAVASTHWPLVASAPRAVEVAFLACYRTVFAAAVACVLLLSVSRSPVGRSLGRVLSSRFLYPFGQLAYSAYLLNPVVTVVVDRRLSAVVQPLAWSPVQMFLTFLPLDAGATFVAAAAVYVFVERPFMELRPRAAPSRAVSR